MMTRTFTAALLASVLSACSSSGDTAALALESAQSCAVACAEYPNIESFSFEAGGGAPLLFSGRIGADCHCSAAGR